VIELTDEMADAFHGAAWPKSWGGGDPLWEDGLAAVLALVEQDRCLQPRGHVRDLMEGLCSAVVETKGALVRCGKRADGHDAHLARHDGWDVIW
jgi:hypothetical protein